MSRRLWFLAVCVGLASPACGARQPDTRSGGSPTPSPSASQTTPREWTVAYSTAKSDCCPARLSAHHDAVLAGDMNDLYLVRVPGGNPVRLTTDSDASIERQPVFIDETTIAFMSGPLRDGAISVVDVETRRARVVWKGGLIFAHAWSPDRRRFAVLYDEPGANATALAIGSEQRAPTIVHRWRPNDGREFHESDDVGVRWSPDGTMLAATSTMLQESEAGRETIVVRADGGIVAGPMRAAQVRWKSPLSIIARDPQPGGAWFTFDVGDKTRKDLDLTHGTFGLDVSPEEWFVAYHDGSPVPAHYIFDFDAGEENENGTGLAAPLWLDERTILWTKTRPCAGLPHRPEMSVFSPRWAAAGEVVLVTFGEEPGSGATERIVPGMRSTIDAAVWRG